MRAKKNAIIVMLLAILLVMCCVLFAACDSYPSAKLKYRNFFGEEEELTFKLADAPTETDTQRTFAFDGSLHAVYDKLQKKNKDLNIKIQDDWIVIQGMSNDIMHTAVVFGDESTDTYVLSGMCIALYGGADSDPLKIFFPLYTLPSSIQKYFMESDIGLSAGINYDCTATLLELREFYESHGFLVKQAGTLSNTLKVINVRSYPSPYMGHAAEWDISVTTSGIRFTSVRSTYSTSLT